MLRNKVATRHVVTGPERPNAGARQIVNAGKSPHVMWEYRYSVRCKHARCDMLVVITPLQTNVWFCHIILKCLVHFLRVNSKFDGQLHAGSAPAGELMHCSDIAFEMCSTPGLCAAAW